MRQGFSLFPHFKRYYKFPFLLAAIQAIFMNCGLAFSLYAQSIAGITNQPDTSYTTYSAYINAKKNYPDIKVVKEFKTSKVSESRWITYCDINDRQLKIDAFYPKEKTILPRTAIIIIYGGGWRSGNRTQHYPLAQQLADLGYVCFTPEYRLSTEALYPAAVYDIKASIRWVHEHAKEYDIDTSHIAVLGFSAGGELAAFMGSTNNIKKFEGNNNCLPGSSSLVHAVIDIDGILSFIHPESGEGDDSKKTSAATYWFGYSKTENPSLWKEASSLTYAGKQNPPTLFINSSVARMHAGRNDFINILNKYGIYTEVYEFENSPHSFCLFDPWFQPTVKYIDSFLKKIFLGE
ncbi:MAG TPA: alpha/beta hydrolase [Chitinophagaceae bacterium]|nr:alpha/beta hydrolase [Chitinophagaceae bacterium]